MIEGAGISVVDYGADPTGVADSTAAINTAVAALTDNSKLIFPPGVYSYQSGVTSTSFDGLTNVAIVGYGAKIVQPVETTTGRVVTRKCLYIKNSVGVSVIGLSFYGNHLDTSAADNSYESGLSFEDCEDCLAFDCYAENVQIGFIANSCDKMTISDCTTKTTRVGFQLGSTTNSIVSSCISDSAHYWPLGATADEKSGGQGFLSDQSENCIISACTSIRGGSECFRVQHSTVGSKTNVSFVGCKSIDSRRYAYSIRSQAGFCSISGCETIGVGDPAIWDGSTYFEPNPSNVYAYLIDSVGSNNSLCGSKGLNIEDTGYGIYVTGAQENLKISECTIEVPSGGQGLSQNAAITGGSISDNVFEVTGTTGTPYALNLANTLSGVVVKGNCITGGYDGIFMGGDADDNVVCGNVISNQMRHGISCTGNRNVISENNIKNVAQTVATGAGIYLNGASNVLGPNIVSDTQSPATLYRALWLSANATDTVLGPVVEYGTSTGIRSDVAITASKTPLYGKGAAATDIGTLLTSLRAAAIIET